MIGVAVGGLVMLIILIRSSVRSQIKNYDLIQRKERMEGELQVASKIQRALVPDPLRSFTERKDLDMAATIIPAKEVGGDLYDFFIRARCRRDLSRLHTLRGFRIRDPCRCFRYLRCLVHDLVQYVHCRSSPVSFRL